MLVGRRARARAPWCSLLLHVCTQANSKNCGRIWMKFSVSKDFRRGCGTKWLHFEQPPSRNPSTRAQLSDLVTGIGIAHLQEGNSGEIQSRDHGGNSCRCRWRDMCYTFAYSHTPVDGFLDGGCSKCKFVPRLKSVDTEDFIQTRPQFWPTHVCTRRASRIVPA